MEEVQEGVDEEVEEAVAVVAVERVDRVWATMAQAHEVEATAVVSHTSLHHPRMEVEEPEGTVHPHKPRTEVEEDEEVTAMHHRQTPTVVHRHHQIHTEAQAEVTAHHQLLMAGTHHRHREVEIHTEDRHHRILTVHHRPRVVVTEGMEVGRTGMGTLTPDVNVVCLETHTVGGS